jgi:two-component system, NtrC family, sensor kinase
VTRLCEAHIAALFLYDGEVLRTAAHHGVTPEYADHLARLERRPGRETPTRRAALERQLVHVVDLLADPEYVPAPLTTIEGGRTVLSVPMLRDGQLVGVVTTWRRDVRSFSDRQIALARTFTDQALIAIENVRLFNETKESLEQQTATAEILRVIASSPTNVQPVFDAIVANAARLCGADFSAVTRFDGGLLHLVAVNNMSPAETAAYHTVFPRSPGRHFVIGRAFVEARLVHVEDIETDPDYDPRTREILGRAARYRTVLGVPILRDGVSIGAIGCGRHEMKPFTATQLELVKTFADQAVIAIENVRLFTELQEKNRAVTQAHAQVTEALDQQTATAEILRVIASSPTDAQPVFDTIAESAARLCEAVYAGVFRFDGELVHFVAHNAWTAEGLAAVQRLHPRPPSWESVVGTAILDGKIVEVRDYENDPGVPAVSLAVARALGHRSNLAVPLLREGTPIGAIAVARATAGPFLDRHVTLLKTFAAQAVIAIENVRLFTELGARNRDLTEALEQQTATGEILRVIASSPTDLQPVMDTVAENAARVCGATDSAIFRLDGEVLRFVARHGALPRPLSIGDMVPARRGHVTGRAVLERRTIHVEDLLALPETEFPETLALARKSTGVRTLLATPLLREGVPLGAILIRRADARPSSARQIELLARIMREG